MVRGLWCEGGWARLGDDANTIFAGEKKGVVWSGVGGWGLGGGGLPGGGGACEWWGA